MSSEEPLRRVAAYYAGRLREHGATARGVDWSSGESQVLRFEKLLEICPGGGDFSLLDYGCGYGALLDHLEARGVSCRYTGYDVAVEMVAAARARHSGRGRATFTDSEVELPAHDYAVASGILNVKLDIPEDQWRAHVWRTLEGLHDRSLRGFAFNVLTLYSDPDRRRSDLYYADPRELFDLCKRQFSPRVSLLHDYPLYEFTILVRKEET